MMTFLEPENVRFPSIEGPQNYSPIEKLPVTAFTPIPKRHNHRSQSLETSEGGCEI